MIDNDATVTATPMLLRPDEVADYLRVRRNTVYKMLANGEIPCICIGGRRALRVRRSDLAAYLERCATIAPAVAAQPEPARG